MPLSYYRKEMTSPTANPVPARSTLRQRRFRRFLFSEAELSAHAPELEAALTPVRDLWRRQSVSEPEIAALYIKRFLSVLRPRDYRGGPHGEILTSTPHALSPTVGEFAFLSFRSVPLAVNRALVAWSEGRAALEIFDHVPDAMTILQRQSQGRRVVTCIFEPKLLSRHVEDARDPLGFALHDLIHADHFFRFRDWFEGQKDFYQRTLARLEQGDFAHILNDEKKARRFEYVIADMNSHPAHLEDCLSSIIGSSSGL